MTTHVQDVLPGMPTDPETEPDVVAVPDDVEVTDTARIIAAIATAARHRRDLVHIAAVRRHLPHDVRRSHIGHTFNRLARRGVLVKTGRFEENGDNTASKRNATKASPVWRLVRPITEEDYR